MISWWYFLDCYCKKFHSPFPFQALLSAWKEACAAVGSSKIMIPKGTYLLGVVDLKGPCKGAMHLEVQGTFIAPTSPNAHNKASWITFAYIDRLTISGGGTFDGRGEIAWKQNNCGQNPKCKSLPIVSTIECSLAYLHFFATLSMVILLIIFSLCTCSKKNISEFKVRFRHQ